MSEFYDKKGKPIDLHTWGSLMGNRAYKVVKQETLPNDKYVSTVWIGINHNFSNEGKPLIFETMVFFPDDYDVDRYSTLEEAIAGHKRMVKKHLDK